MRDSHDGYPCREPELLASLHAAEAALRQARRLMKCHAIEDEQGRWAACSEDGTFDKDKALPREEWCEACLWNADYDAAVLLQGADK